MARARVSNKLTPAPEVVVQDFLPLTPTVRLSFKKESTNKYRVTATPIDRTMEGISISWSCAAIPTWVSKISYEKPSFTFDFNVSRDELRNDVQRFKSMLDQWAAQTNMEVTNNPNPTSEEVLRRLAATMYLSSVRDPYLYRLINILK